MASWQITGDYFETCSCDYVCPLGFAHKVAKRAKSPSPSGRGQGEGLRICIDLRPSPAALRGRPLPEGEALGA